MSDRAYARDPLERIADALERIADAQEAKAPEKFKLWVDGEGHLRTDAAAGHGAFACSPSEAIYEDLVD